MDGTFVDLVFGDQVGNVTLALRDKPGADGKVNQYSWFKWPVEREAFLEKSEKNHGVDVYYSPIVYGDKKNVLEKSKREIIARTPENALTTQVIYADSDTARPDDYRLMPSIVVQTSTGRYHCYWMLTEPVDANFASEICHRVTTAHEAEGSDQNGWSANKVLRIPGSMNTSHGFPERVKVTYTGEVYDVYDISGAYDDVEVVARAPMRPEDYVPIESPEDLPDYETTLDKLSPKSLELALAEPKDNQDRSKLRYRLLCNLFRDGLDFDEVLSIAWHAPASRKWSSEDPRGIAGLQAEAGKAEAETQTEIPLGITPVDVEDEPEHVDSKTSMLSDTERKYIENDITFVDRYVAYAASKVSKQNPPYDRMNAWLVLSAAYCTVGVIPINGHPVPLNIWGFTMGDTTSGKTQAYTTKIHFMEEIFGPEEGFDIGGNPSPSALQDKLIERDGKVSWFNKDEAHGALKSWQVNDWQSGLLADLALLIDGRVPASLRKANKENSGKTASTYFLMDLVGTPKLMMDALSRDMFDSGFLARFQFVIGETRIVTRDTLLDRDSDGTEIKAGFDFSARQFAAEFADTKRHLRDVHESEKFGVKMNKAARERLADARWYFEESFKDHPHWDILQPSMVRTGVTIRKCASLLALSEGRDIVTVKDILHAIKQAEEWVDNLLFIAARISGSEFQRQADEVEEFIREAGGTVKRALVVKQFRKYPLKDLIPMVESLKEQARVFEFPGTGGQAYISIRPKEKK